jgi:hypothetical protein
MRTSVESCSSALGLASLSRKSGDEVARRHVGNLARPDHRDVSRDTSLIFHKV